MHEVSTKLLLLIHSAAALELWTHHTDRCKHRVSSRKAPELQQLFHSCFTTAGSSLLIQSMLPPHVLFLVLLFKLSCNVDVCLLRGDKKNESSLFRHFYLQMFAINGEESRYKESSVV